MARLRGILNDNTVGTLYTNTDLTATANATNIIASGGAKRTIMQIASPGFTTAVTTGLTNPFQMYAAGIITKIEFTFRSLSPSINAAPAVSAAPTWVQINQLPLGGVETVVTNLYLPALTYSSNTVNLTVAAGDRIRLSIARIVPSRPGQGLIATFNYYTSG